MKMEESMVKEMDYSDTEDVPLETHSKLLNAVSQIYKKQRIAKPSRREPTSQISEFNLSHKTDESSQKLVSVKDLVNALNKRATHHEIKKKVKHLERKSKPLPKPMEKIHADKIRRKVGYSNVRKQLNRWEAVVQRNRAAEQLQFPLKDKNKVVIKESNDFLKTFKEPTELEKEVAAVLQSSEIAQEEKEKEEELFPLSLEEIIERRKMVAHMRARESYKMAKAYRQNKIKSKKYHRILKRERIKNELKDFELLQKTNPEAALEKLEKIERARAEERITLRHKNTGKWAKNQMIRAKYDTEARAQLAEQLARSRDLTKKLKSAIDGSSSEDEQDNESEEENLKIDPSNPWKAGLERNGSEIDSFIKGYKKFQTEKSKVIEGNKAIEDNSKLVKLNLQESTLSDNLNMETMDKSLNEGCSVKAVHIGVNSSGTVSVGGPCDDEESESDVGNGIHQDEGTKDIHSDCNVEVTNANSNLSCSSLLVQEDVKEVSLNDDSSLQKDVLNILECTSITADTQSINNQSSFNEESKDCRSDLTEDITQHPSSEKSNIKDDRSEKVPSLDIDEDKSVIKEKRKLESTDSSTPIKPKKVKNSPKSKSKVDSSVNIQKEEVIKCVKNKTKSSENISPKSNKNKIKNTVVKKNKLIKKSPKIKTQSGVWDISISEDNNKNEKISQEKNIIIDKIFDNAENVLKESLDSHLEKLKENLTKTDETETQNFKKPKYQADLSFKSTNRKPESDSTLIEVSGEGVSGGENDIKSLLNVYDNGSQLNKSEQVPDIDPNKFLPVKPSKLNSAGINFVEEQEEGSDNEEESEENKQLNLEEAFADDDVVEEFRLQKKEEIKNSKAKVVDLSLPGWGSWSGHNISRTKKTSKKRKTRRLIVKFPKILRKDEKKDYVIINEELNPALKKHMVHDLPFPFTSVKDYETSIRAPVGSNWVPQSAFMKLIKPAVVTKLGAIIEPMTESELVNNKSKRIQKKE